MTVRNIFEYPESFCQSRLSFPCRAVSNSTNPTYAIITQHIGPGVACDGLNAPGSTSHLLPPHLPTYFLVSSGYCRSVCTLHSHTLAVLCLSSSFQSQLVEASSSKVLVSANPLLLAQEIYSVAPYWDKLGCQTQDDHTWALH